MRKFLDRLKSDSAMIMLPIMGIVAADPLERFVGIPALLTNGLVAAGFLVWMTFYAVRVWGQAAKERRDLADKHAAADAQLFGADTNVSASE